MKHLHELSPEQKTRLLAELDGRTDLVEFRGHLWTLDSSELPDEIYDPSRSYDAIIPLVQKLDAEIQHKVQTYLLKQMVWSMQATPSQLCDAVLVATGKAIV
jgi:hypothetical protein